MTDIIQGGSLANYSGSTLEKTIIGTLLSKGFLLVQYRDYVNYLKRHGDQKTVEKYGTEILLRNVPFQTIYNHPGNTEFLLEPDPNDLTISVLFEGSVIGRIYNQLIYKCITKNKYTYTAVLVNKKDRIIRLRR
ncbi:MAG: hypothetical protein A4E56_01449 [Pelotomaculum sp. PtaU1.Bin065]|nr:MAG: hypothetical protein A4E56_01449 [Pelotomaculum sp. PtaU1.Bin065]